MFTLSEISSAHAKVRSGADFPEYAREIHALGVTHYETYVSDGHTVYLGNPKSLVSPAKYDALEIAENVNPEKFIKQLRLHQSGGTDYMTFCRDCAESGIEKWTLDLAAHTCTYYSSEGAEILIETFGK